VSDDRTEPPSRSACGPESWFADVAFDAELDAAAEPIAFGEPATTASETHAPPQSTDHPAADTNDGDRGAGRAQTLPTPGRWLRVVLRDRRRRIVIAGAVATLGFALVSDSSQVAVPAIRCSEGMVAVPAGTYRMGSPAGKGSADGSSEHKEKLPYCIDKTEVTVKQYAACAEAGSCTAAGSVQWDNDNNNDVPISFTATVKPNSANSLPSYPLRDYRLSWEIYDDSKVLSRGASFLLSMVARVPGARDYTCGYRLYRASMLRRALKVWGDRLIEEAGFVCMAELLVKLGRGGARVSEAPLVLRYDLKEGASKMKVMQTISRYFVMARRVRSNPIPRVSG